MRQNKYTGHSLPPLFFYNGSISLGLITLFLVFFQAFIVQAEQDKKPIRLIPGQKSATCEYIRQQRKRMSEGKKFLPHEDAVPAKLWQSDPNFHPAKV